MSRKTSPPNDAQERNTEIALFRYGLISALLFDPLAAGQLEQALRAIAAKTYSIPYSSRTRVSVSSLRRYLQLYNQGGFEALHPSSRSDKVSHALSRLKFWSGHRLAGRAACPHDQHVGGHPEAGG